MKIFMFILVIGYMSYKQIKASISLYGDDFWPMIWGGGFLVGIMLIWAIYEIRKSNKW